MDRRQFLGFLASIPIAAVLVACGDPNAAPVATDGTTLTATSTTWYTTTGRTMPGIGHPTEPDAVVLRLAFEGGLVPPDYFFNSLPAFLLAGDGRLYTPGAVPSVFPGPLLPNILVSQLTESQMYDLLTIAADFDLIATPPDYTGGEMVADAPSTVLEVHANGGDYTHSAYALGIDTPESGPRQQLLEATTHLTDLATSLSSGAERFVATAYRLRARVADPSALTLGDQPTPPTIVDWPEGTGVELATASDCARVDASAVGTLLIDAKQNTYFSQHGVVYALAVRAVLPGDPEC